MLKTYKKNHVHKCILVINEKYYFSLNENINKLLSSTDSCFGIINQVCQHKSSQADVCSKHLLPTIVDRCGVREKESALVRDALD